MSAAPELELLDLAPIVARITAIPGKLFRLVGGAADVAAATAAGAPGGAVALVMTLGQWKTEYDELMS